MNNPRVVLFAANAFLCEGCNINFYANPGEGFARHFTNEDSVGWGCLWDEVLEKCPNAGERFSLPVCHKMESK